jgi:hypothetical protein
VSLDRSSNPDSLVTAEYTTEHHGRIIRWPLDGLRARLRVSKDRRVHPVEGWYAQVRRVQGATFAGNRAVVSGLCQPGSPAVSYVDGSDSFGGNLAKACLYRTRLLRRHQLLTMRSWTTVPANIQNVTYWPSNGRLWTVNEFRGDKDFGSDRLLMSFHCPALACG